MTNQLTGRALDEAVAKALGWTFITFPDGVCPDVKHWKHPKLDKEHWRPCAPFSTDAACLPEMLAWLTNHGSVGIDIVKSVTEAAITSGPREGVTAIGADISEALARLVVAVGEAR